MAGLALGVLAHSVLPRARTPIPLLSDSTRQKPPRTSLVRGLRASEVSGGRLLYTLEVGAARLEAGKVGLFRVGFVPALALDDVDLTVYAEPAGADADTVAPAIQSAFLKLLDRQNPSRLGRLGGGAVALSRFRLRVVRGRQELAALSAERGELDLEKREISLEGGARLTASGGLRRLDGERLRVAFGPDRILVEGPARLVTPEGTREGRGLAGDLFLRNVSIRSNGWERGGTAAMHETEEPEKE